MQTESIDLTKNHDREDQVLEIFARSSDKTMKSSIDSDGLPYIGQVACEKKIDYVVCL